MLIFAARQSGAFLDCRVRWWPAGTGLSVWGAGAAMAFDRHLPDRGGGGWTEQEQIGAVFEPGVAGGERHHLRLADHRDGVEVEARECLADRQASFGKMALDAATAALRHLVLGERGEEACRRPAFLF